MEIKFDKKTILKNIGIEFKENFDYINYMQRIIEELERNNKNYTKQQYFYITEIKEILENIKI